MKQLKNILLALCLISLLAATGIELSHPQKNSIQLETKNRLFIAGNPVQLTFSSQSKTEKPKLFIIHSYGKTILNSSIQKGKILFELPQIYTQKSGIVSWFLIDSQKTNLKGTFEILPNDNTKTQIENYFGPRSILAGGQDFSMMVTVPTDNYDNPKQDGTVVTIKDQFLNSIHEETLKTKNFISWKNIYSSKKSGQILASSACQNTVSKEIETEVYPNLATDFLISFFRNHDYADGNQITTLNTSAIKDEFGNIVSDGTVVLFDIITKNNFHLKTTGTTLNGVASGQILHPDHPEVYAVTGYINGIAKSNTIGINYKAIINTFSYFFSNHNRKITVGPLTSFMGQLIPDGIKVTLKIFHSNKPIETLITETNKGIAHFELPLVYYKEKEYSFEITTLGITQKTKIIHYDTRK